MPIVMPDPTPEPWCTLDGEAMPYSEWERRIGEQEARCTADGVLAAIDACLDDYAVSGDAMRCAPDKPTRTPLSVFHLAPQVVIAVDANTVGFESTMEQILQAIAALRQTLEQAKSAHLRAIKAEYRRRRRNRR